MTEGEEPNTPLINPDQHESLEGGIEPFPQAQEHDSETQITQSEGAAAHEEHGYSVKTPPPNEATMATSAEGKQIPVRYDGDAFTQTDYDGKSLITGENLSPDSPLVGENYVHNPEKAHDMALAGNDLRKEAAEKRDVAKLLITTDPTKEGPAQAALGQAKEFDESASLKEEVAGNKYDEEHGSGTKDRLKQQAETAKKEIDEILVEYRHKISPLARKALERSREFLDTVIIDPAPPTKGVFDEVIRFADGSWQDEKGGFHDGRGAYYPPDEESEVGA